MSRGFFIGAGCGVVVAGLGLVAVSQFTDFLPAPQDTEQMLTIEADAPKPAVVLPVVPEAPAQEVAGSDVTPVPTPNPIAPEVESNAPSLPDAQVGMDAPSAPTVDGAAPNVAADAATLAQSRTDDAAPTSDVPPEPVAEATNSAVAAEPMQPAEPEMVPTSQEAAAPTPVVRPSTGFGGDVAGVKIGRLPTVGDDDQVAAVPEITAAEVNALPAVERFAASFENPSQKPLFSILLRDTGGADVDREALAALPFPVSFVIDPTLPDAASAAQIYRANGKEVLMLGAGIPEGATASDLAVSMETTTAALPEAVGIVDLEQGGFQGDRILATQVLALVRDHGLGVISWDRGLNAASQIAQREGMRSAVIFRSLDGENEGAPKIRRYLDRAAFKAAQDGRVVVAGKTRPETIAALLEWAEEGRASMVTIAPSSAVMMAR
ncbi:hypothetical protein EOK75_03755 [Pseudorhodobacter turbinis]|uniref:Divergent polysaccharide deacetylase family protein n=1 Tax=Pseudorhodobacter turbinis TaxID=2500533 RepID=A0A4P8EDF9_9RHOB|nr:divergent polysaccharide deacetylase family protein [Pseudorhodobacter turbinis]QCO54981.1 hypothetical protein EOK75_03755 [Pseudorhodobacter turbinis]